MAHDGFWVVKILYSKALLMVQFLLREYVNGFGCLRIRQELGYNHFLYLAKGTRLDIKFVFYHFAFIRLFGKTVTTCASV